MTASEDRHSAEIDRLRAALKRAEAERDALKAELTHRLEVEINARDILTTEQTIVKAELVMRAFLAGVRAGAEPAGESKVSALASRVLSLIPENPEILSLENPHRVVLTPGYDDSDLRPTIDEVNQAVREARRIYRERKG